MINLAKEFLGANLTAKKKIIDYYNANCIQLVKPSRKYKVKYVDNWCATFTSVIAHKCGLDSSKFPYECGVQEQVKIAKVQGTYFTDPSKATVNDLVIYDWDDNSWADHVGFVVSVKDGVIKVIEGNIRNTVAYRSLPLSTSLITGFIRVDYKEGAGDEEGRIIRLARRVIAGELGTGLVRQRHLGEDYKAVQVMVNKLLK